MTLTELFLRNRSQTSTVRPPRALQGTSGSTMVVLTRADKWVRTVDRWRQYASPERKDFRVYTDQQQFMDD